METNVNIAISPELDIQPAIKIRWADKYVSEGKGTK